MSGLKKNDVLNSVQIIANQFIEKKQTLEVQDYKSINISTKIIRIIRSYTQYVNRTVWHK